ncbi:hypothetical protein LR48_Vigan538s000100 [Vigna angularis]|uniref:Uncharacterized protein n=1 Tax=Phaseolus angularis TaxID=3914 RepID=A0A0L9TCU6_PHAAN|nr:hypothetical protein LR48_Vigan538s000100 [Vigna angularis]
MSSQASSDSARGEDERNPLADNQARTSGNEDSSHILEDNDVEQVAIHVNFSGAWDGKPKKWSTVAGYDWAPHKVKQIASSFHSGRPIKELISGISLVKELEDASHFKIAISEMTKRVCLVGRATPQTSFTPTPRCPSRGRVSKLLLPGRPTQISLLLDRLSKEGYFLGQVQNDARGVGFDQAIKSTSPKVLLPQLISLLNNKNLHNNVFDYLSSMDPTKSSTFARLFALMRGDLKKSGKGTLSRAPITPSPPKPIAQAQQAQPQPTVLKAQTTAFASPATAAVKKVVEVIHIFSDPIQKKKKNKRKAAREPSVSSKCSRRALPNGPPLSGSLDPSLWVAKRIHFDLFPEEKGFVEGMTEEEGSNMAFELGAWSTMCMAYADEKKAVSSTVLQALQEKYDEAVKSKKELTLRLAEVENMVEDDKNKAKTLRAESHSSYLLKLENDKRFVGDEVVNEHVLGFENALTQCILLFQVPIDDPRLDVGMIVVNDELVPMLVPPPSTLVVQAIEQPPIVEVIVETNVLSGPSGHETLFDMSTARSFPTILPPYSIGSGFATEAYTSEIKTGRFFPLVKNRGKKGSDFVSVLSPSHAIVVLSLPSQYPCCAIGAPSKCPCRVLASP